jgi:hypothetical protein
VAGIEEIQEDCLLIISKAFLKGKAFEETADVSLQREKTEFDRQGVGGHHPIRKGPR